MISPHCFKVPLLGAWAVLRGDLQAKHIVSDRVVNGKRAMAALDVLLTSRDIPLNMRVLAFKTCVLPVLMYGCEVWGMNSSCGVNRAQTALNQAARRLIGVGRNAPGVACSPILRELGVAPIEAIAAGARARAFIKAQSLGTYISHLARQPFRSRHVVWSSGTVRWMNRWARQAASDGEWEQSGPWEDWEPRDAAARVRSSVWSRFETSGSTPRSWLLYNEAGCAENPLLRYSSMVDASALPGLVVMAQLRTRVFPTVRHLASVRALPQRFLEFCPICGRDVPESVPHMLWECSRWEHVRRNLDEAAPALMREVRSLATSAADAVALLLGGTPSSLSSVVGVRGGVFLRQVWRPALHHIALFVLHLVRSRSVFLRGCGLSSSRITRTGQRPDG